MATIKAIEGRTVHQIQSGQVIVDLCSVVKELVENSLDAGATSIDVRFKNQGLESIEVQDNGDGISPQNYETLALKHHTSKLSTYSDLTTLQTFGFRGEALSSLCALSQFSVTTCRVEDAPKGTKLEFEVSGKLKGTSVVAAQKGTTVSVENLFNNLPVRRRELERNIKREWGRVVGVLGQYACIQTGIKFSVSQQAGKGKKTTLFSTKGNKTTRENIVNVFGAKTLTALVPLDLNFELEATSAPSQRWSTQEDGGDKNIKIVGHISRPASGEGRQTPDRQMFFVNARPCGLPQVAKAFNEVYKSYNASQSPFIFANIELDTHLYDVNVSPDKRTILLHDQTRMLENLKEALVVLFDSQDYTVPISQLPAQRQPSYKQLTISREHSLATASPKNTPSLRDAASEISEREDTIEHSRSSRRAPSTDGESESESRSKSGKSAVSRDSMGRDGQAANLISNWASRGAEKRNEINIPPPKITSDRTALSKEKQRLVGKLAKEREQAETADSPEIVAEDPVSSVSTTQSSLPPATYVPPIPVADFNTRLAELKSPKSYLAQDEIVKINGESPIPALQSPSKEPPPLSSQFSSSIRPKRGPTELATITIGDHTTTSPIGTPSRKIDRRPSITSTTRRSRIATPRRSSGAPLPSFGSRLSQRFAAPGTQQPSADDESEEELEDDEQEVAKSPSRATARSLTDPDEDGNESVDSVDPNPGETSDGDLISKVDGPTSEGEGQDSDEYIDEAEKKAREDAKVQEMIQAVEEGAMQPTQENILRAKTLIRGASKKKDTTINLIKPITTTISSITQHLDSLNLILDSYNTTKPIKTEDAPLDSVQAEEKLSLTISKPDFARMKIIGQFNLGFILASRISSLQPEEGALRADDLFIIDQHASDEKYNFERLQATTIVQSQPLVHPKTLSLTALEEEIVLENLKTLETNGFQIAFDHSETSIVGQRCSLLALPLSRETTFSLSDLEELISMLSETTSGAVPRPSKVRKMFAMRACRSSIMIGKTLSRKQMEGVVRHMGELDKPWNCPHGRPTMRHLCGLGVWDEGGWQEGDWGTEKGERTDWAGYLDKPWNCPHGRPTMRHLCGLGVWDEGGWQEGDWGTEKGERTDWAGYVRASREESDGQEGELEEEEDGEGFEDGVEGEGEQELFVSDDEMGQGDTSILEESF
ncbi:hypothetical protein HYFRA_00002687 [Hymenoscyphus fraxineus]|uniref:DNA mismatch repair protein PMS1 n=1 Tax=Hymenoscyphus fraxineus TaxID=746836 RepID=A0A9N9PNR0_9HELO|nr:hypothetical protein HYFRA_00002687 [Hymenoscyphus fraxineus]